MAPITVFQARKIITMDPNCPEATHVAVRDGRILAVGDAGCADQWGDVVHDHSLADAVLMPGMVEGHAHMMAGAMWKFAYAGFHDRMDPQGKWWRGKPDIATVVRDLTDYAQSLPEDQPLIGWGLDPIFFTGERLSRAHLDQISTTRPIAIMFSNFHLMCVNSAALAQAGYDHATNVEGVVKGPDGAPTGELQEMAAMFPVMRRLGMDFRGLSQTEAAIESYGAVCMRAGVTTVTDLYSQMEDADLAILRQVTARASYPTRLVPVLGVAGADPETAAARAQALARQGTDKLRLGAVK
ncbi:MAG: amidohydrolase family protein, partial [Lutimaribacter sp.]